MTSITHSGAPVALSWDWTNFSPVEASKFRTGSNAPAAYDPPAFQAADLVTSQVYPARSLTQHVGPSSSRPIVPVAAAGSRARFARRSAIGVPPTLDSAAARRVQQL